MNLTVFKPGRKNQHTVSVREIAKTRYSRPLISSKRHAEVVTLDEGTTEIIRNESAEDMKGNLNHREQYSKDRIPFDLRLTYQAARRPFMTMFMTGSSGKV